MKKKLIALTGLPGAGKDELAKHYQQKYGLQRISFADPMRQALEILNPLLVVGEDVYNRHTELRGEAERWGFREGFFRLKVLVEVLGGWDVVKREVPEVREMLRRFGTEIGRDIFGADIWVSIAWKKFNDLPEDSPGAVFTDCRFENEATLVKENCGHIIEIVSDRSEQASEHRSDSGLPEYFIEGTIDNSGTIEDLQRCGDIALASFHCQEQEGVQL